MNEKKEWAAVNDYTRGVVESLSWMLMEVRKNKEEPECSNIIEQKLILKLRGLSYHFGSDFESKMEKLAQQTEKKCHLTL